VMVSSGHKNTRDDNDDEDLEKRKNSGRLHGLVLLGRTGIVLIGGREPSIARNESGEVISPLSGRSSKS
jgi:hypothetical protein